MAASTAAAAPPPPLSKEQRRAAKAERKAAARAAAAAAAAPVPSAAPAPAPASTSASAPAASGSGRAPRAPRSAFVVRYASMQMAIPPALSERPAQAVQEAFDSMLMRYVPPLGGVLVAHDEAMFLSGTARFDGDGAYAVAPAAIKCLVWAPTVGMRVEGTITLSTPSHVSLLLHGTFNASISAAHLPSAQAAHAPTSSFQRPNAGADEWEFIEDDEAAAEDAARRRVLEGGSASEQSSVKEENPDADDDEEKPDAEAESAVEVERSLGYWKRKSDGQRLGGADGRVAFTVIGMTIANHQLSLHGSLLPAPFSVPLTVPLPAKPAAVVHPVPSGEARRVRWQDENSDVSDDAAAASSAAAPAAESRGKKRKMKVAPRQDGDTSASEAELERTEKKQRKKEKKEGSASESESERAAKKQRTKDKKAKREQH